MATRANYVKLGLFVILGLSAAATLAIIVGALKMRREKISYVTYFVESVQGLEVGAPVKDRGVTIGRVGNIAFAPDHEMVEVRSDLDVATLKAMGLKREGRMPPDVRAQLASQGLVGTRFLALDLFDPATNPLPVLSFTPPERYIPATRSVQKSLEESAAKTLNRLAEITDTLVRDGFAQKTVQAISRADTVLAELDQTLKQVDGARLPARTAKTIDDAHVAVDKINKALDRVDGEAGLIASAQRAIASFGEAGRNASTSTGDLGGTLSDIREAAAAIRNLAEELERNPDMLVKGRARPRSP